MICQQLEELIQIVLQGLGAIDPKLVPRIEGEEFEIYATFRVQVLSSKLHMFR